MNDANQSPASAGRLRRPAGLGLLALALLLGLSEPACAAALRYLDRKWAIVSRVDRWHESHRDEVRAVPLLVYYYATALLHHYTTTLVFGLRYASCHY